MNNDEIHKIFGDFLVKYDKYFTTLSDEDLWMEKFNELNEFIRINNKLPSTTNNKSLNAWLYRHHINFNKKIGVVGNNEEIYKIFKNFLEKYKIN